jgi:hypothetical protein
MYSEAYCDPGIGHFNRGNSPLKTSQDNHMVAAKLDIHPKTRYNVSGPKIEASATAQATFQFYKLCEDFHPRSGIQS